MQKSEQSKLTYFKRNKSKQTNKQKQEIENKRNTHTQSQQAKYMEQPSAPKFSYSFPKKNNPTKISCTFSKKPTLRICLKEPIIRPTKFIMLFLKTNFRVCLNK